MFPRSPRAALSRPRGAASQRGSIAVIAALAMVVIMGFGALAIDVSYMRLSQAQCQDVADAASQTALFVLRRTGDEDEATTAAQNVIAKNVVAGQPATLHSITFGDWDETSETLVADPDSPNAVSVTVTRQGSDEVGLFLGRMMDRDSIPVAAGATSATRDLHVILAMDITNSWNRPDYYNAREAAVQFYDVITNAYGPHDKIGMAVFTGRYAWEFTPLTLVEDAVATGTIRAQWAAMETASKPGEPRSNSKGCKVIWSNGFDDGGCFPDMPREYKDEPGTDHSTGLAMAEEMFAADSDDRAYKAVVFLTDGYPNGTSSGHGTLRQAEGYEEDRWAEYLGPVPHTTNQVKADSVALAESMYDNNEVNTWVVSFVADSSFMYDMAQGDGYFERTDDSAALVSIFDEIANSLPLAIVK